LGKTVFVEDAFQLPVAKMKKMEKMVKMAKMCTGGSAVHKFGQNVYWCN
jgi:hypothetical protein